MVSQGFCPSPGGEKGLSAPHRRQSGYGVFATGNAEDDQGSTANDDSSQSA